MSKIEVNTVEPQCGTNLTIGASGDTITFPSGTTVVNNGSQTGFGRSGTVDWQTGSLKTTTFTAVSGEGYFINQGSAITMNLPAGSAGAIVAVSDYARNFATYNLTISPNGSEKIGGVAQDAILNINGQAATFVYVDSTKGWVNVQNAEDTETGLTPAFVAATGGTETTVCTNFKVHTFTGPGTFCVSNAGNAAGSNTVSYMVVAGGGGGGGGRGGGGGAGGFREGRTPTCSYTVSPLNAPAGLPVTAQGYPIAIGAAGSAGQYSGPVATAGGTSSFSTISSAGGGLGGGESNPASGAGGSGGGGARDGSAGAGNTPPVSPPQGNNAGAPFFPTDSGGSGGGATATGGAGSTPTGGAGGAGATTSINGTPTAFAGGGGASGNCITGGAGGAGGGGAGATAPGGTAACGTTNTGGGGGGGRGSSSRGNGGNGGSGIVIVRYKFQ